jgi:hypothetical protein
MRFVGNGPTNGVDPTGLDEERPVDTIEYRFEGVQGVDWRTIGTEERILSRTTFGMVIGTFERQKMWIGVGTAKVEYEWRSGKKEFAPQIANLQQQLSNAKSQLQYWQKRLQQCKAWKRGNNIGGGALVAINAPLNPWLAGLGALAVTGLNEGWDDLVEKCQSQIQYWQGQIDKLEQAIAEMSKNYPQRIRTVSVEWKWQETKIERDVLVSMCYVNTSGMTGMPNRAPTPGISPYVPGTPPGLIMPGK